MKKIYSLRAVLSIVMTVTTLFAISQNKVINVNLYGTASYVNSAWNNWNVVSSLTSPALKYSDGSSTSITSVLSAQGGYSDNGATYPVTMCPQQVGRDASYATSTRTNTLNGLDNTKLYDIQLYASRGNAGQTTRFTVNGTNVDIATNSNFTNIATFSNIAPSAGKIVITIANLATYNYLNGFTLTEKPGAGGTNQSPVANAGTGQTITLPTTTATLTGSGTDADGTVASYVWSQTGGTAATITSPSSATTTITGLTTTGTRTFTLTVTDNLGATGTSTVTVTVNPANPTNQPPVASAGSNQTITLPTTTATLTGSGTDADGTVASYAWSQTGGTAATITSPGAATTTITGLTTTGVRTFLLTVTDNQGATGTASVTVTVNAAVNQSPVANAGSNQSITLPTNTATLTGSGTDADGTVASYAWSQTGGTAATITSPGAATTTITGLTTAGVRTFLLTVRDNLGATGTASVTVTVGVAINQSPVANAGSNQTITLPTNMVALTGSGTDADGTIASYAWTQTSGTTAAITSPGSATTTITGLTTTGTRVFKLTVTDNQGTTGSATVTVTVSSGSVFDPSDPVITYDPNNTPATPPNGTFAKWIRSKSLDWNTDSFKCYIYNGRPFRLRFPKSYRPGVNDGKIYPVLLFFHGDGEGRPTIYDNEYQLYHGGQFFSQSVDNGTWDGYVLCMQTTGSWGTTEYGDIRDILNYMITNNKLDPFHVVNNGLSAGGQGTWEMYTTYPTYIAGLIPMSAVYSAYTDPAFVNKVKYTPIWNLHGGQDGAPAPFTAAQVLTAMQAGGANYVDKDYTTLGHDTWDSTWLEPNFWPFLKAAYMSNPWTLFGRTQFCPGDPINVTVGLLAGLDGYQWRKNGVVIPGATSNTINVTAIGSYDARVLKGSTWSDWSHVPVVIAIKAPTVTPNITVSGLMSKVIPAADGNSGVNLKVPSGYVSYTWQKAGSSTVIGTDSILAAGSPGNYIVQVTEQFGCSSSFSNAFTVVDASGPNKPDPAAQLAVTTRSKTALELDWSQNPHPTNNETNFEVYRGQKAGGPYKLVTITAPDVVTYIDSSLPSNFKYYYVIRAVDNTGAAALSNEASGITAKDTLSPTAPSNLTITAVSRTSIGLSWGASTDDVSVTGYDIYINGLKSYTTTATQFLVNSLTFGQLYDIVVKAKDPSGNVSSASNQVATVTYLKGLNYNYYTFTGNWATLPDFTTLTPAASGNMPNVAITPRTQDDNFSFYWYGFINIPVAGTYTFRTNSDDGSKLYLGSLNGTVSPYNFSSAGTVNSDGQHGAQDATSADLTLAAGTYPIAIVYFEQGGGQSMTVSWKNPQTGGNFVAIPDSAFGDRPIVAGIAPAIPTGILAGATTYNKVNLSWVDNSNNESGFEIFRAGPGASFTIIATTGANVTSFVDSAGLQPSSTYYYKVQAINQFGSSGFDPASQGGLNWAYYTGQWNNLPNFSTLTPVSTGSINNISLSPAVSPTNYALTFKGTIRIPRTGTYTFYTASDDGSKLYISGNMVVNNDFLQGTTERSGTVTLNAGSYPFEVDYFQQGGGVALTASYQGPGITKMLIPDSAFVNPNTTTTTFGLPSAPVAPGGLVMQAVSPSKIGLSWSDTASGVTGYNVYRSTGDSSRFLLIKQLAPTVTNYTDTGLFAGQTYYYKVSASWVGGNTGYSATVTGQPSPVPPVITKLPNEAMHYGTTVNYALSATSTGGGTLSFSAQGLPAFGHLTDNGNGGAVLSFSPAQTDEGLYNNLMVVVTNTQGGADTTTFSLTVNDNYIPVMDTITSYTINEADSLSLTLHASDQNSGDTLSWTVSNLPAGYTLTNVSNGVAGLVIRPGYAAAGTYAVQVTVSDGKGGVTTRSFGLVVNDKTPPTTKVYIRFKENLTASAPWNNISGPSTSNLLSDAGTATPVGLQIQGSWFSTFNNGPNTGNNSGIYPDVVLQEYYFFGAYPGAFTGPSTVTAKLTGLDTAHRYTLSFYAGSIWGVQANNGVTTYTVGSQTVSLAVQNNTRNLATFSNLKAAADGTITFSTGLGPNTLVGYLNAIVLTSVFDDGTSPAAPTALTASDVPGQGAQLSWRNVAYNASGNQVLRTTDTTTAFSVVGQASATAVSYTDTTAAGNTHYYYKVQAVNANGSSPYSNIAGVVTSDKAPRLTAIGDLILHNDQQTNIAVTATDEPGDHVTLTATNLPSFASFTDNGDGTGTISVVPNGAIGSFNGVTVTATDNSDSSRSTSFNISVVDKNVSSTYVMFSGGPVGPQPWNSFTAAPFGNTTLSNLLDDGGTNTGMSVTLVDGFQWFISTGMRPGNGMTIYPEPVIRNGFYESSGATHTLTVNGLSSTKRYNFVFFNSHDDGFKCLTNFTINGQTVSLNATYNINKTVQLNGITPAANGKVTITVAKAAGQDYAFLTTMVIQSYDPNVVSLLSPSDLRVINSARTAITLQWADRSTGETAIEVWRSNSSSGSYSLVQTLPANTTKYTDSGLTANTTYYYTLRAVNSAANSDYSGATTATTLVDQIYINFANGNQGGLPWFNTNAIPQQGYTWNNLYDELGLPVNTNMMITRVFDGLYSAGVQTGNNSGIFPDKVMFDSYGLFPGDSAAVKIGGLNLSQVYNFTFFGSTTVWGDVNTSFTINGRSALLNTSVNSTGTVTLYGVVPDANGEVSIGVAPGTSTSQFGLLGAMVIGGYNSPVSGQAPAVPGNTQTVTTARSSSGALFAQTDTTAALGELKAFPNPFTQGFTLVVPAKAGSAIQVLIYDVSGRVIYGNKFSNLNEGDNYLPISTNVNFAGSGVYIVRVIYPENGIFSNKVIKLVKKL